MNSELFSGVGSMNQLIPFASWSIWIVPALGIPFSLKPVIVASASCPMGRSVMTKLIFIWVESWRKFDRIFVAVLFELLII